MNTTVVIAASAIFYCVSMVVMKLWDDLPVAIALMVLGSALIGAVVFEIIALRGERLGLVYIAILGAECVIMALVSMFAFGEEFSTREVAGATLVVAGALISSV